MALVNNEQGELCGHVCAQHGGQLLYGVKKGLLQLKRCNIQPEGGKEPLI